MSVTTDYEHTQHLQKIRNYALAICLVSMVISFGAFALSYQADNRSQKANASAARNAQAEAAQAKGQTQFLKETFCGLVGPLAAAQKVSPPTSPFGLDIAKGSVVANGKLACDTPTAPTPLTTTTTSP